MDCHHPCHTGNEGTGTDSQHNQHTMNTPPGWTQEITGIYKRGRATVYKDNHGKWHDRTVVQYRAVSGAPADSFEIAVMNLHVRLAVTAEETQHAAQELFP